MNVVKTALGCIIALGTLADLLLHSGTITKESVMAHGAFLLFAGILIDPEHFKNLAFWRKDGGA